MSENTFEPDWASAPGETIEDILEEQGLSRETFCFRAGWKNSFVLDLIKGLVAITPENAKKLEAVLGPPVDFWLNREEQYRADRARLEKKGRGQEAWLRELPLRDMIEHGWLKADPTDRDVAVSRCLDFFGVSDIPQWRERYDVVDKRVSFRTSQAFRSRLGSVAAWLRQGELEARNVDCRAWNRDSFRALLPSLRRFSRISDPRDFLPKLQKACAEHGVAVAIVRSPSGCRASGATFFVTPERPLLLFSFRYLKDDHFWFTFFHEAGHLLMHRDERLFLEGVGADEQAETEANVFAERMLISDEFRNEFETLQPSVRSIVRFARKTSVSPGIVVGQLQHAQRIGQNQFNALKVRYRWENAGN